MKRGLQKMLIAISLVAVVNSASLADDAWVKLTDCRLIPHSANDGDSFHIKSGDREYLVRLYFVDAPEHSMQIPQRVAEQAKWFDTTDERVLHYGKLSGQRVAKWLDAPFTIYTQFIDARGASRMQRIFAMVQVGDRYLSEILVENGLARIYGIRRNLHDGTFRWDFIRALEALEAQAKKAGRGLWEHAESPPAAKKSKGITLSRDIAFYTTGGLPTFRGMLKKGAVIEIVEEKGGMVLVQAPFRGKKEAGQCRRQDLPTASGGGQ